MHIWVGWFVFLLAPGAFGEKLNKGTMCFDTPCTFQDLVKQWALINLTCSLGLFSLLEKQRSRSKALPLHIPSTALGGHSRRLFPTGKCRPLCSMPKCSGTWKCVSPCVGVKITTQNNLGPLRGIRKEHTWKTTQTQFCNVPNCNYLLLNAHLINFSFKAEFCMNSYLFQPLSFSKCGSACVIGICLMC